MNKLYKKYFLGIDCGSVSLKVIVMDEEKNVLWNDYQRTNGDPLKQLNISLKKMFCNIDKLNINEFEGIYTTGSGRFIIADIFNGEPVNEITAHGMAASYFYPNAKTIIEIGGQDSKLILLNKLDNNETVIVDSQMNDICAAGTGSFLDQQAYRMGISIEELSEKACISKNPSKISGRCSVFAKTDMIHLQQEGISIEDISSGLCRAVVRTFVENLIKGREIKLPILFQGGVARNNGVKEAFIDILKLQEKDIIVPNNFDVMGAIGAIFYGVKKNLSHKIKSEEILIKLKSEIHNSCENKGLELLTEENIIDFKYPIVNQSYKKNLDVYLGIDVGSVSAKIAVIDKDKNVIFKYYAKNEGKPIDAIKECFTHFKTTYANGVNVKGVGVTGSGRDYVANYLKADVVKNEITAQAKGISTLIPDVNTIIEIGGQDSKYIRIENQAIVQFIMNKTCAAGTGSFLTEQADRLKINLSDFSKMAFNAKKPLDVGTRCTVFMETDCIHHQQNGESKEDIVAGLSYSIAKNYIEKVVGNQPIDGKIIIQGGIAFNRSVVSAFGNILNKPIVIAPHHEVTGALGMAFITREEMSDGKESKFIGFDLKDRVIERKIIQCKDCSNLCSVISMKYNDASQSIHGGICGKYEKNKTTNNYVIHNYFEERKKLLVSYDKSTGKGRCKIGIPRMLLFHELFPLWATFFNSLNYDIVLSQELSKTVYEKGLSKILVDTCFPIRSIYGAVKDLIERGAEKIFIPYVINMKDGAYETKHAHNCQYIQQVPDLINASFDFPILTHTIRMKENHENVADAFVELAEKIGVLESEAKKAYEEAVIAQNNFYIECKKIGNNAISDFKKFPKVFVLIGHQYILHDKFFNLNLVNHLGKIGIPVISSDMLPLSNSYDKSKIIDLAWKTNNMAVNAIEYINDYNSNNENILIPIIMTQLGCAADSMLTPYLKDILGDNPWMELEVDEYNSVTGMMTRCEAFWESIPVKYVQKPVFENVDKLVDNNINLKQIKKEERTIYIIPVCESMYAVPEVLSRYNIKSEMIDKTTVYSNDLGRKYSNEKHCRTYQVILGDYLATIQKKNFDPNKAAFFMFGYDEACRLSLFNSLHPKVLKEHGAEGIKMFGTTVDDPLGWINTFGLKIATEIWMSLVAGDYLSRYMYQLRPYEKVKGSINNAYKVAKAKFYKGIKEGRITRGFREALEIMSKVPLQRRELVHVGIVGDAFTRVHEYGMNEIFNIVESMGGVVMLPPSWNDFINYGAERRADNLWSKGLYTKSIVTKIGSKSLDFLRKKLMNISAIYSEMFKDPDNQTLTQYAKKYVNIEIAPVIPSMFIGKTVDFVQEKNVHGLINAYGFNCCLGKITTACINKLRIENNDVPMFTFIDDGLQQTNIKTRVEAFMEQSWAFKRKIDMLDKKAVDEA